jgi:hypothetical protein
VKLIAAFTTDASGDVTVGDIGAAYGTLEQVKYNPGSGGTVLDTGVDITITDKTTGATVFSLTNAGTTGRVIQPTVIPTTNAGVAVTPGAGYDVAKPVVSGELRMVVAAGGNAKSGSIELVVAEFAGA